MLTVQVMEELLECCLAVGPNHKGVVNVAEPGVGAKICVLDAVKSFMYKSARTGDRGDPMAIPEVCSS